MDFLRKELGELPEPVQQATLKQLESIIREIHGYYRDAIQHNTIGDFTLYALCGKLYGIVDSVRNLRKVLGEGSDGPDES